VFKFCAPKLSNLLYAPASPLNMARFGTRCLCV